MTKGADYYRKEAERGDVHAQFELGYCYEHGIGVDKNRQKAIEWYAKASEKPGDPLGAKQDQVRLLSLNAEEGMAASQWWLSGYYFAKGNILDDQIAFRWCSKSAEQDNRYAQLDLGMAYASGKGIEKDEAKAVFWYKKAANQGDQFAQYLLGKAYENGCGVPLNLESAVRWYQASRSKGWCVNQYALGRCFYNGNGVPKDIYKAAKCWFSIFMDLEKAEKTIRFESVLVTMKHVNAENFPLLYNDEELLFGIHAIAKLNEIYATKTWRNSHDGRKSELPDTPPDINKLIERIKKEFRGAYYIIGRLHELGAGVPRNILEAAFQYRNVFLQPKSDYNLKENSTIKSALKMLYASDDWKIISDRDKEKVDQKFVEYHGLGFFDIYTMPPRIGRKHNEKAIFKYFTKSYLVRMAEDL